MRTAIDTQRAIGIIRVSASKGREGDSFASPVEQRDKITAACKLQDLELLDLMDEIDVSGGTPLERRTGMREAVEAIEAGEANVIVAAYFDRLFRNLAVQEEVLRRVEAAGGKVLALDTGQVSTGSAGEWLDATMRGMMAEYQRRTTRDRSGEAQRRAVERGVPPWPNVTPGYVRADDGRFRPDPAKASIVRQAFELRADGGTVMEVRAFLTENGVLTSDGKPLSQHGVGTLLSSRVVLGEINFGKLVNLNAHEPIVDRDLWNRVQRITVSRGRRAKSDRLLARLGVLRCASCGARMVVGTQTQNGRRYPFYRCPPNGDCKHRVTVSAEIVESIVVDTVKGALANVEGRASAELAAHDAEVMAERTQAELDAAIRAFTGLDGEQAAVDRLAELRLARDRAQEQAEHLRSGRTAVSIRASEDWDRLTLAEQRGLVRAVVAQVVVGPGRGADRITVELVSE
jgi:site-specific DNA recombinase